MSMDHHIMQDEPLVSVIIPTYNRAHYVVEAVESVLAQTHKNIEIIVVDDGSTDGAEEILDPYKDRIRYFYQENQGVSAARNLGIRNANGQYLAFLDSDDLWLPDKTELQLNFLKENDNYGFVFSNFLIFTDTENETEIANRSIPPSGYIFPQLFMGNFIGSPTMLMRR